MLRHLTRSEQVVEEPVAEPSSNRHVVAEPKGGWDVEKRDSPEASAHTSTQAAAITRAEEIVRTKGGGEVRIHGTDGRMRDSDTVAPGRDPSPPRDICCPAAHGSRWARRTRGS